MMGPDLGGGLCKVKYEAVAQSHGAMAAVLHLVHILLYNLYPSLFDVKAR